MSLQQNLSIVEVGDFRPVVTGSNIIEVGDFRPVATKSPKKYSLKQKQEAVREFTTYFFTSLFVLTALIAFYVVIWHGSEWTQTKDLIELLLPAETALIGSAIGFYFGSKGVTSDKS